VVRIIMERYKMAADLCEIAMRFSFPPITHYSSDFIGNELTGCKSEACSSSIAYLRFSIQPQGKMTTRPNPPEGGGRLPTTEQGLYSTGNPELDVSIRRPF